MYIKKNYNIKKLTQKVSIIFISLGSLFTITMPWGIIAKASSITSDLNFTVAGKSIWGAGDAIFFRQKDFRGVEWDKTINFRDSLGILTLNGNTSGKIGLEYDFTLSSGSVNISYPVQSTLLYPEVTKLGKTIKLNSSFINLDGALLETFSPQATAKLELPFQVKANVGGNIDLFGLDPIPFNLIPSIDIDKTYTFFDLSTSNPTFSKDFGGFGGIEAHIPKIDTSGGLSGQILKSEGKDDFLELSLDVDKVASTLIPQLPSLERELLIGDVGSISYNLLDITAKLKAGFQQVFEFIPGLNVKYLLENGQEFITRIGDAINFPVPANVGDSLKVTATYFLDNSFSNKTDLALTPAIGVEAIQGTANIFGEDIIDFGPFYQNEFSAPSLNIPVFSNQFSIDGFPIFKEIFEIDIVEGEDFGDAPDSYRTLLASDGPRYLEGNLQRLGTQWERESNGQPTRAANGDDKSILGGFPQPVDDEDGVIFGDSWVDVLFNITRPGANQYQLRAWWDTSKNGQFDHSGELYIDDLLTFTPGTFTKRYNLGFDPKKYYSRFRLTWNPQEDVKPWGEVFSVDGISHGEVEDYAPVPEPSSIFGTIALGLIGLMKIRKKS